MTTNNNYCVIMAGGIGSRFWPYSRKNKPKQFLDFFGTGDTLLQLTYNRYSKIVTKKTFYQSGNRKKNLLNVIKDNCKKTLNVTYNADTLKSFSLSSGKRKMINRNQTFSRFLSYLHSYFTRQYRL